MENFINKIQGIAEELTEKNKALLGIDSISFVSEAAKKPTLCIKYTNGKVKKYNEDSLSELVTKIKNLKSPIFDKYQEFEETVKDNFLTISSEQVASLQEKLKGLEGKLKEAQKDKVKVKTITITETCHNKVKKFCAENDLQISDWVESTLTQGISDFKKEVTFNDKTGEIKIEGLKSDVFKKGSKKK